MTQTYYCNQPRSARTVLRFVLNLMHLIIKAELHDGSCRIARWFVLNCEMVQAELRSPLF